MGRPRTRRRRPWRGWNRLIHRYLGFFCVGLVLVYAGSGLAVNHVGDWNPNYIIRDDTVQLAELPAAGLASPALVDDVLDQLGLDGPARGSFRSAPDQLEVFIEGGTVSIDLASGRATVELVRDRPVLRSLNFLHLNEPKGVWTAVADAFAVALILLALTGLVMVRGPKGIRGTGGWFLGAGLLLPLLFLLLLR